MPALVTWPTRSPSRSIDSPCHSTASGAWTETSRRSRLGRSRALERVAPDEVDRLPARDREPEAGRERVVERADVVAPRAEAALQPRGIERERPGVAQPEVRAGRDDVVVQVADELGRHGQLPAELTGERHAERPGADAPDLDLACVQERPGVGGRHPRPSAAPATRASAGPATWSVAKPEVTSVTTASARQPVPQQALAAGAG